jgi:hypothetical protein
MKEAELKALYRLRPCNAGWDWVSWMSDQPGQKVWEACDRGDWMAWLLAQLARGQRPGVPMHKTFVLVSCHCFREIGFKHLVGEAPRLVVEEAEAWALDKGPPPTGGFWPTGSFHNLAKVESMALALRYLRWAAQDEKPELVDSGAYMLSDLAGAIGVDACQDAALLSSMAVIIRRTVPNAPDLLGG